MKSLGAVDDSGSNSQKVSIIYTTVNKNSLASSFNQEKSRLHFQCVNGAQWNENGTENEHKAELANHMLTRPAVVV